MDDFEIQIYKIKTSRGRANNQYHQCISFHLDNRTNLKILNHNRIQINIMAPSSIPVPLENKPVNISKRIIQNIEKNP